MDIGEVVRGKYAGAEIVLGPSGDILYISTKKKKIALSQNNVAEYKLRPELSRSGVRVYVISWLDGKDGKSLIRIPENWVEPLVAGCEMVKSGKRETCESAGPRVAKIIGVSCTLVLILMIVVAIASTDTMRQTDVQIATPTAWSTWDGTSENMPNTKVPIYVIEAIGNTESGFGSIRGIARNRTTERFNYIQITFGMYNSTGRKVGTCLANISGLDVGEDWAFEASCLNWPTDGTYKIDEVSYF